MIAYNIKNNLNIIIKSIIFYKSFIIKLFWHLQKQLYIKSTKFIVEGLLTNIMNDN